MSDFYGIELILDLHNCSTSNMTRDGIKIFLEELCELINMEKEDLHFWDFDDPEEYEKQPPHLKGISAVQFITTSDIVIHTLDEMRRVYVNVFSCKEYDTNMVQEFTARYFDGEIMSSTVVERI